MYENITKWRLEHNISVYAIENGCGFPKGTIKSWKESMPSWEKVLRVANFLDVSVDYLVGNTLNPKSHKNNSQDCAAAINELIKIVDAYSDTNKRFQSSIKNVLTFYHIKMEDTE